MSFPTSTTTHDLVASEIVTFEDFLASLEPHEDTSTLSLDCSNLFTADTSGTSTHVGFEIYRDMEEEEEEEGEEEDEDETWDEMYSAVHQGREQLVVPAPNLYAEASIRGALRFAFTEHTIDAIAYESGTQTPLLIAPAVQFPADHGVVPHIVVTAEAETAICDPTRRMLPAAPIPWAAPLFRNPQSSIGGQVAFQELDVYVADHIELPCRSPLRRADKSTKGQWTMGMLPHIRVQDLVETTPSWMRARGRDTKLSRQLVSSQLPRLALKRRTGIAHKDQVAYPTLSAAAIYRARQYPSDFAILDNDGVENSSSDEETSPNPFASEEVHLALPSPVMAPVKFGDQEYDPVEPLSFPAHSIGRPTSSSFYSETGAESDGSIDSWTASPLSPTTPTTPVMADSTGSLFDGARQGADAMGAGVLHDDKQAFAGGFLGDYQYEYAVSIAVGLGIELGDGAGAGNGP